MNIRNSLILALGITVVLMGSLFSPSVSLTGQIDTDHIDENHPVHNSLDVSQPSASIGQHYQVIPDAYAEQLVSAAIASGTLKHFTLIATSDRGTMALPTGEYINLMTFNGTSPAPTLRVIQGDVVQVTVYNYDDEEHSIDFHGAQLSAVPNFAAIDPGLSKTLTFVAVNPGVWIYHCEANNVFELWEHPLKGMSGMLIVDPKLGYTPLVTNIVTQTGDPSTYKYQENRIPPHALEFSLTFGEYYLSSDTNVVLGTSEHDFDQTKMFNKIPTYTHVNGIPYGYLGPLLTLPPWSTSTLSEVITTANLDGADPVLSALTTPDTQGNTVATQLNVRQGEHVRFFVENTGDNEVAFHIVGEQLDRVAVGNSIIARGVQTWGIPAYSDATIDVVFEQPGVFAIVNHDYSELFKGQGSIVVVWPKDQTPLPNPSNAVPPVSALPLTSIPQPKCLYGIGPDNTFNVNSGDDNQFISRCKIDRKSTRLNSSHLKLSRMPSSA